MIAATSSIVVIGGLTALIVTSAGWPKVRKAFFDGHHFRASMPQIWAKFGLNVKLFLLCEVGVLVLGLLIAVVRTTRGPALFPFRMIAIVYTDVMRGVPLTLMIYLLGFGVPALGLNRPWNAGVLWGGVALMLVYAAYVAEVFRAGIESIHPSQMAAARSLGLSRTQAMRYVVLPQAVRRVVPPLLNDFIGLQKDTAQVQAVGALEALRAAQISSSRGFNFTPYLAAAVLFIAITVPQARFVDWLLARRRRSQQ